MPTKSRANLKKERSVPKRQITLALKKIEADKSESTIKAAFDTITPLINKIKELDKLILLSLYNEDSEELPDEYIEELDDCTNYHLELQKTLNEHKTPKSAAPANKAPRANNEAKLPELKCSSFTGEDVDSLKYHDFLTQFKNVVDFRVNLSDSSKFTYLRSYLRGYALKIVQHLTVTGENYSVALKLLENEFLNKEEIVNGLFKKLLSLSPVSDDFQHTKLYLTEIRCILSDLNNYDRNLLTDKTSEEFISHIVFSKLPVSFRQEAARKLSNNYPSLTQIFENYVEILRMLSLQSIADKSSTEGKNSVDKSVKPKISNVNATNVANSNFNRSTIKVCKFCSSQTHTMVNCKKYATYSDRVARCKDLNLCSRCTSSRHDERSCTKSLTFNCSNCGKNNHIQALCRVKSKVNNYNKPVVSSNNENENSVNNCCTGTFLLPTITIAVKCGNPTCAVRCLVDTGSQRSYISARALRRVDYSVNPKEKILINTFLESSYRTLAETSLTVSLGDICPRVTLPFLIDDKFLIKFETDNLGLALNNIMSEYTLADTSFATDNNKVIELEGLLGVDTIQHFSELELRNNSSLIDN